jgi:hypothetical protein
MRYQPLESLSYKSFVAPNWDKEDLVDIARWINNQRLLFKVPSYKYFFGRESDGRSLSKTSKEHKEVFEMLSKNKPDLDYTKSFNENVSKLRKEIEERNLWVTKVQTKYEQMRLLLPA